MIPLHVHSNYSLLSGAATIDGLITYAKKEGLNSLALTDTNGMYGLIYFAKRCKEEGIKPILGAVLNEKENPEYSAVFLAKNNAGYSELCNIITTRKLEDDFSLLKIINKQSPNLFILISSIELLNDVILNENIFVELVATKERKKNTRKLYEFARDKNVKYVATHPVYFLEHDDFIVHKVLTAVKLNSTVEKLNDKELVDKEFYWQRITEIKKKWKSFPDALNASDYIAENCNVDLRKGEYKYPKFLSSRETDTSLLLWKEAYKGLKENYIPLTQKALDRLRYELSIINESNLADYFLIVWDIIKEAQNRGMMFIGRGSAANSIVAYCLGLTQVDPVRDNLSFDNFLNKGQSNLPDVNIDFSWKERDDIIKYIFDRYGHENAAMISTAVKFKARSAFREVAKAFGLTSEEISKYSKYISGKDAINLEDISEIYPGDKNLNFNTEPWRSILQVAAKIVDFPRYLGIHPSGIIITPEPVNSYVALEYANNNSSEIVITQPDIQSIEDMGFIKINLYKKKSLGVLRDALNRINFNYGRNN